MNVPESFLSCIFLQCMDHNRCFFFFFLFTEYFYARCDYRTCHYHLICKCKNSILQKKNNFISKIINSIEYLIIFNVRSIKLNDISLSSILGDESTYTLLSEIELFLCKHQ
ncbi:hypothetical protein PUN28_016278 [Cardiocondyla obscurior]|uniref:Uncharacterized protein n=1 Tax=Cardiocondyla obscurior TaxID=286306 RepID=A0AAW2ERR7_9HYME